MVTRFKYVQSQNFSLAGAGAVAGATSVTLKEFKGIDGVDLTMTDFGLIGFATIEPGNGVFEEQISFTGVVQNANGTATLTGVSTVLFINPYTAVSGLAKTHAGSVTLVISNTAGFYDQFPAKANDETITGQWTFSVFPITPANSPATTTTLGVVRVSVAPANPLIPIAVETTDPRMPVAYAIDAVGTDAYAITPSPAITAYAAGQIFTFKAGTANTGTATLNVNGLGAKTIKKYVSTDLDTGDILLNQIVMVEYDGTNMQIISGLAPLASTTAKGLVEEATDAEVNAGTQTGGTGAELFINPLSMPGKFMQGMLGSTVPKTYFNQQIPWTLWTGAVAADTTTTFANWLRSSTDVFIAQNALMLDMRGTGSDYIVTSVDNTTTPFLTGASTYLEFDETSTIVIDWFAKYAATGTGDNFIGFGTENNDFVQVYNATAGSGRVGFAQKSTGELFAVIYATGQACTATDISSGLTLTNWNYYRIELHLGTDAKFYVNGVLKATLSGNNLYKGSEPLNLGTGRSNTTLYQMTAFNVAWQLI